MSTSLICPSCHGALTRHPPDALRCHECQGEYTTEHGIVDFSEGQYYDAFEGETTLSAEQLAGLSNEVTGTRARIEDFYLPLLCTMREETPGEVPWRVLDSGCGNGLSVDLLNQAGFEAWGNDISALRKWQWRERQSPNKLIVADTRMLPFPDHYFDAVLSSGVLEHVGVEEEGGDHYSVKPRPSRDAERLSFLQELLRVTSPSGTLLLDFPNGAFPIDFWHGARAGSARFHALNEGFLPKIQEINAYFAQLGSFSVTALSPYKRLRMRQVGAHWYGRAFRWPMMVLLRSMQHPALRFLAASSLNPYLVLQVESM